jgi:hypothetical protein
MGSATEGRQLLIFQEWQLCPQCAESAMPDTACQINSAERGASERSRPGI